MMQAHEKAFQEIKNYYNDITHSNLDLIRSLKEEVADMKTTESSDQKLMYEIAQVCVCARERRRPSPPWHRAGVTGWRAVQENKRMSEPLKRAVADVQRLREERERCAGGAHARALLAAVVLLPPPSLV